MDKGYAFPEVYELLEEYGYTIHIRLKGKERTSIKEGIPKYRHRRWVVERTHSRTEQIQTIAGKMGKED